MVGTLEEIIEKQRVVELGVTVRTHPACELALDGQKFSVGGDTLDIQETCLERDVPTAFGIHPAAFEKLTGPQRAALFSFEQRQRPDRTLNVIVDLRNVITGLHADGEIRFLPSEILAALMGSVPDQIAGCFSPGEKAFDPSPSMLDLTVINATMRYSVRPGDIVSAGLEVKYPLPKDPLPYVRTHLARLVCTKGLTITQSRDPMESLRTQLPEWAFSREVIREGICRDFERAWEMAAHALEEMQRLQNEAVPDPLRAMRLFPYNISKSPVSTLRARLLV